MVAAYVALILLGADVDGARRNEVFSCDRELRKTFEALQAWRRAHNGDYPPFLHEMKRVRLLPRDGGTCPNVVREAGGASAKHHLNSSRGQEKDPEGSYEYELSHDASKIIGERRWHPVDAQPFTRKELKVILLRRALNEQIPFLRCKSHRDIAPPAFTRDSETFRNLTHTGEIYWSGELWEQNWLTQVPYPCRDSIVLYGLQGPPFHTDRAPELSYALDLRPWSSAFGDHPWWWTLPLFDDPPNTHVAPHLGSFFRGEHGRIARIGNTEWWVDGVAQLQGRLAQDPNALFREPMRQCFLWERTGLEVNRRFREATWLQGTIWTAPAGETAGSLVWHYSDGSSETVPIIYGQTTGRFWADPDQLSKETNFPKPAWKRYETDEQFRKDRWVRLYEQRWSNPRPSKLVKTLDFVSNRDSPASPFLIAVNLLE